MNDESLDYDVAIVGGGPAGLAAAIKLKQLANQLRLDLSVCLLEKGAAIGAHNLSGAVLDPKALNELIPDWAERQAPLKTKACKDNFYYLTQQRAFRLPTPPSQDNNGNYLISISQLCRWLGEQAEAIGVEIFAGFAVSECLYDDDGNVCGLKTGDMGQDKDGNPGPQFQPGVAINTKYVLLAEGARGSLTKSVIKRFQLEKHCQPQTYGIGLKELWRVDNAHHQPGTITHTIGWPLDQQTYGGSFVYHYDDNIVSVGLVVGLDYQNPYLSPYQELQRFKTHPAIKKLLANGERLSYGARALTEGGYQSIPQCHFPGGLLIGCAAGFMNVAKIKGNHTAMKSGMLAAETLIDHMQGKVDSLAVFQQRIKDSWLGKELYQARNIRPGFKYGLALGVLNAALETFVWRGRAPWTFKHSPDHLHLQSKSQAKPIDYPKADNTLTFDRLTSLSFSNVAHEENQPCHLQLQQPQLAIDVNWQQFASPEQYYCPAGVYEMVFEDDAEGNKQPRLQINAQNCLHCKTCDIKDPKQNINWVPPEGGGGPNYSDM